MNTPDPKITVPKPQFSFRDAYFDAIAKAQAEHAAKEVDASGRLRGGTVGCLLPSGQTVGTCPKSAIARYLGYSFAKDTRSLLFFENGFANEATWATQLDKLYIPWIRDEKCQLSYPLNHLDTELMVTGSPDQVAHPGAALMTGAEHKAICSEGTAVSAQLKGQPKDEHLIQAAHYSAALGSPYHIVYSNLAVHNAYFFTKKEYPEAFKGMKKPVIPPAITEFPLDIEDGLVHYWVGDERRETIVTVGGILDYYRMIIEAVTNKDLTFFERGNFDIHNKQYPFLLDNYCDTCKVAPSNDWDEWNEQLHTHIVANGGISGGEIYEST